jgi:hypothetical protein
MIERVCPGCGLTFTTSDLRKRFCIKACGRVRSNESRNGARTTARAEHKLSFIGVDGEGSTLPTGEHIYHTLSVGNNILTRDRQLTTGEIFEHLWTGYETNPNAVFVGYFLDYDFTQWFRGLPEERARMLLTEQGRVARRRRDGKSYLGPFPVHWDDWQFDMLGRKRLKLRPAGHKSWMYINDVGPYFQTSFVNTINPKSWTEPVCTPTDFDLIVEGKSQRGVREELTERHSVERYNTTENRILADVMVRMNTGLSAHNIRLDRDQWYGPGQAAQAWLDSIGMPTGRAIHAHIPDAVADAARATYYGGWFEVFAHGHLPGETFEYDINSAYPSAMTRLPCLVHGQWQADADGWPVMTHALVQGSDPVVGAMPHRRATGAILRPRRTRGWYWAHELTWAAAAGVVDGLNADEVWSWHPDPAGCPGEFTWQDPDRDPRPRAFRCTPLADMIPHIYNARLAAGKNSPQGKALKIVYNSCYGKFAQSIGKPKYSNPIYASLITADCRSKILQAIATHPTRTESLVMVATDGVYFREPHPGLDIDPQRLGAWDETVKHNLTIFMPGVYWDDKSRDAVRSGNLPALKSRGISSRDLAAAIEQLDQEFHHIEQGWPTMAITTPFSMITATQALAWNRWHDAGTLQWAPGSDGQEPITRTINSDPKAKRDPHTWLTAGTDHRGDYRTAPWNEDTTLDTHPYDGQFGRVDDETQWGVTPDTPDTYRTLMNAIVDGER